jgi:CubicO group peptidase (beta-lactamase class C family)
VKFRSRILSIIVTLLVAFGVIAPAVTVASGQKDGGSKAGKRPAWEDVAKRIERVESTLMPAVIIAGKASGMKLADRMAHYKVPGLSVAVINEGKIEWARSYGVAEAGSGRVVSIDTLFQAASISKPVAALGALRLVERGKLNLDEDVNQRLRSWQMPESEFTKSKKVTLRGLLSHSAGTTVHGFRGYAEGEQVPTLVQLLDGHKPANSAPVRVDLEPGSRWRYSGGGTSIAQQLMMDVTGKPFPEYMREAVLGPAGMSRSTYEQPLHETRYRQAATGHTMSGDIVKGRWHTHPEMAAAGLWTTPSDLARLAIEVQRAFAGRSNKIISKKMAAEMLRVQSGSYGLGFGLRGTGRELAFSHGGSNVGFKCLLFAYAETGQGAVLMANGDLGHPLIEEIMRAIAKEYNWPDYRVKEKASVTVDPKMFADYAGEYESGPRRITISADGARLFLVALPYGRDKVEMFAESDSKYFVQLDETTFTFFRDASGNVTELVVQPQGQEVRFKKIK